MPKSLSWAQGLYEVRNGITEDLDTLHNSTNLKQHNQRCISVRYIWHCNPVNKKIPVLSCTDTGIGTVFRSPTLNMVADYEKKAIRQQLISVPVPVNLIFQAACEKIENNVPNAIFRHYYVFKVFLVISGYRYSIQYNRTGTVRYISVRLRPLNFTQLICVLSVPYVSKQ
jgi:hypothetical protein